MMAEVVIVREYAELTTEQVNPTLNLAHIHETCYDWLLEQYTRQNTSVRPLLSVTGRKSLKLDSFVGFIQSPCGTSIEILPKHFRQLPDDNEIEQSRRVLLKMVTVSLNLPVRDMGTAELKLLKYPLPEWIYARFLQELERLYKRGVRFTYQTTEEESRFLRGQLNTSLQLRQPPGREHRFQIRHEIFTANRPENRLLKRALEYTRNQVRQADNWRLANELSHLLEPISASDDVKGDFQRWNDNRLMVAYRDIKPWCELILYQLSPITQKGSHEGNSLLFPMEKLFENYVEFCLRKSVKPGWHLQSQAASQYLCRHQPEQTGWTQNMFLMKPDFVLSSGSLLQVLDTKWKLLNAQDFRDKYGLKQADFYQMFAYGQKYLKGNGELMLIYPATDEFTTPLSAFDFDDSLRLWVVPFDLHTDRLVEGNYTDYFPSLFLSQTFGSAAI